MATPFLYTFGRSALAAYPFILRGTRQGLSSRAIESAIRASGLPISRGRTILPIMRRLEQLEAAGRAIRFIPKSNTINVDRLPEAITRLRREFSYSVRVTGIDPSGRTTSRFVTVSTDNPGLTPGEIEQLAADAVGPDGGSGPMMQVQATLQSGVRRSNPTITG